jgi:hypothetical protein
VRSVVACLPNRPTACPFAADSSEPDRPQAVKASAVAPPLRGFGLDGLKPPRFGLSKQTKADWGRTVLPTRTAACTNHVLGNGCDHACSVDRKALESRVLTELPERMMTPGIAAEAMRAYAQETNRLNRQRRSSSESTRPELAEDAKAIAKIVRVIGQCGWHRVG